MKDRTNTYIALSFLVYIILIMVIIILAATISHKNDRINTLNYRLNQSEIKRNYIECRISKDPGKVASAEECGGI